MRIIGVILEVNPLHLGHKYFINKVKAKYQPDVMIAVTSTYFTMRGDVNCWTKRQKVEALLALGFDLVMELPFELAVQRADIFALNSIEILKSLQITDLAFGIEPEGEQLLIPVSEYIQTLEFATNFKKALQTNLSYKKAYLKALEQKFDSQDLTIIAKSNFTLATEYMKYLSRTSIKPIIIPRQGSDYHEKTLSSSFPSATAIRNSFRTDKILTTVKQYLAFPHLTYLDLNSAEQKLLTIATYSLKVEGVRLYYDKEGIGNYIEKNGNFFLPYSKFIVALANRKYSETRIKRYLLELLIYGEKREMQNIQNQKPYLRLLGFSENGLKYLKTCTQTVKKAIFSSPNDELVPETEAILNNELKASKLFEILNNQMILNEEYLFPIKKKGE